jgi:hypothetical protein
MRKFKNVLAKMNEDMQTQVVSFVKESRLQLKKTNFNKFKLCIETIMEFNKSTNEEETNYKLINFKLTLINQFYDQRSPGPHLPVSHGRTL